MLKIAPTCFRRPGFSLDVPALEFPRTGFFLFFGENGCGKSTFTSALAGIREDYQGDIFLDGAPLKSLSRLECASRISYLPQSAELLPPLSAASFLEQGLYAGGESRIPELLDFFQLKPNPNKHCGQFSGGETQILRLIRACAVPRPLILLDEPDTFLSQKRKILLNTLLEAFSQEALVLAAVHDERLYPKAKSFYFKEKDDGKFFIELP